MRGDWACPRSMIDECIGFGLQGTARRIERKGRLPWQRKPTVARERGGGYARRLGKAIDMKKIAELGEDGATSAMAGS